MRQKLRVENLEVCFDVDGQTLRAVRGISFTVSAGETLAIVGESGSGKSVTGKALMGILPKNGWVENGLLFLDNQQIDLKNQAQLDGLRGSKMAMIFQDPSACLNPIVRVGKQIAETVEVAQKVGKKEAKKRAIALMEEVGIRDAKKRFNDYPFAFSGGMKQRVVIATALACNPEVLICDEPTTALDVTVQAQILSLIRRIKKERGLSVVFITHDLGVVANVADRVAVVYAGKVVETGKWKEVFYDAKHPYTWALLASSPQFLGGEKIEGIVGQPPDLTKEVVGDAFAPRNHYALMIDYQQEPPVFEVTKTHFASTWLLHPSAPKVTPPPVVCRLRKQYKENKK